MPMLKRKLSEAVSTSLKAKASSFNPSVTLYEVKPEPVPDGENIAGGSSEQAESAVKAEGVTEAVRTRSLRRSTRVKRQDVKDPSGSNSVGSGDGDGPGDEHQTRGRKRVKREELVSLIKMEQEDELVLKMEQIDEAFSSTTRATTRRNSVKATAASPKKRKRIPQALDVPHPAPENWKEVYDLIKDMRSKITAPVDTMGCDQAQRHETDPKNRRFSTLVSLMLSSQTKDEVTDAAVSALREAVGGTLSIDAIIAADESTISQAIGKVGFWRRKTQYLKQAAEKLRDNFDSDVPKTVDELCSLPGVGPKMAFLALQVAWDLFECSTSKFWYKFAEPLYTGTSASGWMSMYTESRIGWDGTIDRQNPLKKLV
ncbi:hypothetical protein AX16_008938 [Volvariella volvacea WC 439]|nr:hypothetical protein AX16_008938 [Volvariella volvacea WC 439]